MPRRAPSASLRWSAAVLTSSRPWKRRWPTAVRCHRSSRHAAPKDQHELALGMLSRRQDGKWGWKMDPAYIRQRVEHGPPRRPPLWPVLQAVPCPTLVGVGQRQRRALRSPGPAHGRRIAARRIGQGARHRPRTDPGRAGRAGCPRSSSRRFVGPALALNPTLHPPQLEFNGFGEAIALPQQTRRADLSQAIQEAALH